MTRLTQENSSGVSSSKPISSATSRMVMRLRMKRLYIIAWRASLLLTPISLKFTGHSASLSALLIFPEGTVRPNASFFIRLHRVGRNTGDDH